METYFIEVTDGPNIEVPLTIANATQVEAGPGDVPAGKFIVGTLS